MEWCLASTVSVLARLDLRVSIPLADRYSVDFAAYCGNNRAVGESKDKGVLAYEDVEKLIRDAGIFKAHQLFLIVAADTEIPDGVGEYARNEGVEIIRTEWRG